MQTRLSERIWARQQFQQEFRGLISADIASDVPALGVRDVEESTQSVLRLLRAAVHLCSSRNPDHRDAAYRIATVSVRRWSQQYDAVGTVASLILTRLGNFPTVDFICQGAAERVREWPAPLWFELNSHRAANTRTIFGNRKVVLTDFQTNVWNALEHEPIVAVSAPTSAGKSFALQQYLASRLGAAPIWCLYLAPTRALLQQISEDLLRALRDASVSGVLVTSVPIAPERLNAQSGVYVLTPERLQLLSKAAPSLRFAVAIVDEAQTIESEDRGILLQSLVKELLVAGTPKILFAAPNTSNPEVFGHSIGKDTTFLVPEKDSPVAQTLVFLDVSQEDTRLVQISALIGDSRVPIGSVTLPFGLMKPKQKLAALAWYLGRGEMNIVYAGGKAECEDIAALVVDAVAQDEQAPTNSEAVTLAREEFAVFVEEHIHPKYGLAHAIRHGVGFHYGNMPALLRNTVENYFAQGVLNFVVCTSTLLYGVNLPAKNIFLLDPHRGSEPVSSGDFWNLAGRAGRLGKDISGRVYLIDSDSWFHSDGIAINEHTVVPALKQAVTRDLDELVGFVRNLSHASGSQRAYEAAFSQLVLAHYRGDIETLLVDTLDASPAAAEQLQELVSKVVAQSHLPISVIQSNPSISPYRQEELYSVLLQKARAGGPESIVPVHPLRSKAYDSLATIFRLLILHLEKKDSKEHRYFAMLALKWMRGAPIRQMIEDKLKRKLASRKKAGAPKVGSAVREVFDEIETDIRFRYVKYTRCYMDLVTSVLIDSSASHLVPHLPAIPLYLELGACSQTMMSLIGIGLSRTTAYLASEKAVNVDMDHDQALAWLRRQNPALLGLSTIALAEIRRVLG